jgi:hypothetical protein
MSITLDGQRLFDEEELRIEVSSFGRDSVERKMAGLDGVLSIDLGRRSRKIKQSGILRARSRTELNERINLISIYMDGDTHMLITGSGESFGNLRMDGFKVDEERTSGSGLCCNYEIVYTQLKV